MEETEAELSLSDSDEKQVVPPLRMGHRQGEREQQLRAHLPCKISKIWNNTP